ncbi:hypothetical protein L5G32_18300 [Gordonia sp. HY002]|uniref:hypothetical protein n=1 Tax=Gordonia zhenghanii TaxID=2911516 RepID=UPI001EEFC3AA|nr:hypothetical protein [Gordonia zhenghanii]MCF8572215.1 hypothetical protein [Gordonia zhenghanii]MCF8606126.1 hypothetical protein [Gordonia zhenghanii]
MAATPRPPADLHLLRARAALERDPDLVVTHQSAAVVHRLPLLKPKLALVDVVSARRVRKRSLRLRTLADGDSANPAESWTRAQMIEGALPLPRLQHEFYDADGFVARSDFDWEGVLVAEFDGYGKYEDYNIYGETPIDVLKRENRRQAPRGSRRRHRPSRVGPPGESPRRTAHQAEAAATRPDLTRTALEFALGDRTFNRGTRIPG